jgi:hypothetical protein
MGAEILGRWFLDIEYEVQGLARPEKVEVLGRRRMLWRWLLYPIQREERAAEELVVGRRWCGCISGAGILWG